ncbi:hypothetical protein C6W10_21640 [Plantactinospora sp. BB1]|nr:hypothetical protein C6W10_21640 [Plantactinospora sp. BB1]
MRGVAVAVAGISVVTPTLGNPELVEELLRSTVLAGRTAGVPWEHIVVDSTPGPAGQLLAQICRRHGASYLRGPDRVGAKRNLGARSAAYDIVAFVDSDCTVVPRFFTAHLAAYREQPDVGGVAGPTDLHGPDDTFALRALRRARQYRSWFERDLSWPRRYAEMGWSTTSNLSVRADVFRAVGGFDERTLTVVGGEDVDFGIRVRKAGHRIVTSPDAVVLHTTMTATRLGRVARRVFRYGQAEGWLCQRHPELTAPDYRNPFVIAAAAGVAGLVLFPRAPRARHAAVAALAVLAAREVASRHERGSGAVGVVHDSVCTGLDMVFDAGKVAAAVQQRRPGDLFRRFRYVQDQWFVAREDAR